MAHKEPRIDTRVYLTPDEHEYLKAVAAENDMSLSELLRTCTLKKCKHPKKKRESLKLTLPSTATGTETNSPTPELTREQVQNRIDEIDELFRKAKQGEIPKIPPAEYHRLKAERFELNDKLN